MISDEWTAGGAALVVWVVLMSGVVHLIERRPQLRYSFARAGYLLGSSVAFCACLVAAGVSL